jgi:hypothetical protein
LLLGLGQVIYAAADATFYTSHDLLGLTAFPAPSDALYLAHYPVMVLALIQLIRLRAPMRNLDGLLDAGTLAVAATLLWWLILIEPQVQADTTVLARIAAVGYPVMDLALLVVAIRLVLEQGYRPASFFLIWGSLFLIMAADTIYVLQQLNGNYATGNVLAGRQHRARRCRPASHHGRAGRIGAAGAAGSRAVADRDLDRRRAGRSRHPGSGESARLRRP